MFAQAAALGSPWLPSFLLVSVVVSFVVVKDRVNHSGRLIVLIVESREITSFLGTSDIRNVCDVKFLPHA